MKFAATLVFRDTQQGRAQSERGLQSRYREITLSSGAILHFDQTFGQKLLEKVNQVRAHLSGPTSYSLVIVS
jgi:hypothetical protein